MDVAKLFHSAISANSPTFVKHLKNSTAVATTTLKKASTFIENAHKLAFVHCLQIVFKYLYRSFEKTVRIHYKSESNHYCYLADKVKAV